jgi:hypothetical protein
MSTKKSKYKTTPTQKKPRLGTQHYKWSDYEIELIKQYSNLGWGSHKIKNNVDYFKDRLNPTKDQIQTKLNKIAKTTQGGLAKSGLENIPKYAQDDTEGYFFFLT